MLQGAASDKGKRQLAEYKAKNSPKSDTELVERGANGRQQTAAYQEFGTDDATLVQSSWASVAVGGDVTTMGKAFYTQLFQADHTLEQTLFRGSDMRAQATRLMEMIGAAVKLLGQPQLHAKLIELGERHTRYGVEAQHFPIVGSALFATLKEQLGGAFTDELAEAWRRTFMVFQISMLDGAASDKGRLQREEYRARHAEGGDVELVRSSWAALAAGGDLTDVGQSFYRILFEQDDTLAETLFKGADMEKQALSLIEMIAAAVDIVDQPALTPTLLSLGEGHTRYGVEAPHFPIVGRALLETLRRGLGGAFTPAAEAAWGRTFAMFQRTMLEGGATGKGRRQLQAYKNGAKPKTDVELVRGSWALVAAGGDLSKVGHLFYRNFFLDEATLETTLFMRSDMVKQAKALIEMLAAAVELLDDALLPDVLAQLGERHTKYGVEAPHYAIFERALLRTLHAGTGAAMTAEVEAAWVRTLAVIRDAMLSGAASERGKRQAAAYFRGTASGVPHARAQPISPPGSRPASARPPSQPSSRPPSQPTSNTSSRRGSARTTSMIPTPIVASSPTHAPPAPEPTEAELVQQSWALIATDDDLAAVANVFHATLFVMDANFEATLFHGVDVKTQATKLVEMVHFAVGVLGAPDTPKVLAQLGETHTRFGVGQQHYPMLGKALMSTLHKALGRAMTRAVEEAWLRAFQQLQTAMLKGASSAKGKRQLAEYRAKHHPEGSPETKLRRRPSETDVQLVRRAWAEVSENDFAPISAAMDREIAKRDGSLMRTVLSHVAPEARARKILEMIDAAVGMLDRPVVLVTVLVDLGETHTKYGVEAHHYPVVGQALQAALNTALGSAMKPTVAAAWSRTYGTIQNAMLQGAGSARGLQMAASFRARRTEVSPEVLAASRMGRKQSKKSISN
jgi:hemoglobin-like flavoprotein